MFKFKLKIYGFQLVTFIFFFKFFLYSQPYTYYWQNPTPQGNPLFKVYAFDTSYAMAVGSVGTLLKTTDGGKNWNVIHKLSIFDPNTKDSKIVEAWIWSIYFYNRSIGWAVGGNGLIIKTEDGGQTWVQQFSGTNATIQSIFFRNMFLGWAVGWNGIILKTTDGGNNWQNQNSNTQAFLFSNYFLSDSIGWAVGERGISGGKSVGEILKTSDGGNTWIRLNNGLNNRLWGLNYKNNACWITGWGGLIDKSTDFGNSFSTMKTPIKDLIYGIEFPSSKIGYAGGEFGQILKTTDGGNNWFLLSSTLTDHIYSISFVNELVGWVVGEYGVIYKTRDGGLKWEQQSKKPPGLGITKEIKSVSFFQSNGWAVGDRGLILKTTNNGFNWTDVSYNSANSYNGASFPSATVGYVVGAEGKIIKSTNGGNTWSVLNPPGNSNNLNAVQFLNEFTGFIIGDNGTIFKTSNGGTTWSGQSFSSFYTLNALHFINENLGFIAGNGVILKTSNGGVNWDAKAGLGTLTSIKFYNENIGWAAGSDGSIVKTIDGGNNWVAQRSNSIDEINCIYITDPMNVWAVGKWGRLLRTKDGGVNWEILQTNTSNFLTGLFFPEPSMGVVFGRGGTIMRFYDGVMKPIIVSDPASLSFVAEIDGATPPAQYINISSIGGSLNWTLEKDASSWLTAARVSDTRIAVQINTTILSAGVYTSTIDIIDPNALNSPQKITITYYLSKPGEQSEINLNGTSVLYFEAEQNRSVLPEAQSFFISNSGKGNLNWNLSRDSIIWFDYTPMTGVDSGTVLVNVNTTNLPVGYNTGKININSPGAKNNPQTVDIVYGIYPSPSIVISDTLLSFIAVQGGKLPDSQKIIISNPGRRSINWTGAKFSNWLTFSPTIGGNEDTITVKVSTSNLIIGTHEDYITFTSPDAANSSVSIHVVYSIVSQSLLYFPDDSVVFNSTELGEYIEKKINIQNIGTGDLAVISFGFEGINATHFRILTQTPFSIPANETKEIIFQYKPERRGISIAILNIKSNAITQNNGNMSKQFIGNCVDTRKPIITANWDSTANFGDSITIKNATAIDLSGIRNFQLLYRQSNQSWDSLTRIKSFSISNNATQFIPGSVSTQNGVDFKIIAEDSAGNASIFSNPISTIEKSIAFVSIPINITDKKQINSTFTTPKVTSKGDLAKVSYKMFSTPLIFKNVTAKDLWGKLGDHKYQWRFRVPVYPNPDGKNFTDGENEVLKSGISYFIITRNETSVECPTGTTKRFDEFYKNGIDLQPGYNYIGNPFAFDIPISKLKILDTSQDIKNSAWYYDAQNPDRWTPNRNLSAWGGYCIKVVNATKLIVTDEEIPEKQKSLQKSVSNGWKLQVSVNDGDNYDTYNYLGMNENSLDVYDRNDMFEPPQFDEGLSVYFPHNDWDKYSGNFSGDFRKLNSIGSSWDFEISADQNKLIDLNLNLSGNIQQDFEYALYDDNKRFIPILNNRAKVISTNGIRHYKIVVGTKSYINQEKAENNFLPTEFKLLQNFPNPFNPQTTISYQLPVEGFVTLEVFSVLGNYVETLVKEVQKQGVYEIFFNAKNLSSGVYFYKLYVTGSREFSAVKKLVLLK